MISVASRKAKGRDLQKWVCQQISDLIGLPWGPDEPISSRPMGQSGTDIRLDAMARERFAYSIECKRQEKWSVPDWIRQAQTNKIDGTDWLLVIRGNHQEPVVVMDAKRFFEVLRNAKDNGRERL